MNTNLDYDTLLTAAQAQFDLFNEVRAQISAERYSLALHGAPVGSPSLCRLDHQSRDAETKYTAWINENLTKRGITLHVDQSTRKPVGLSIVVAGRR